MATRHNGSPKFMNARWASKQHRTKLLAAEIPADLSRSAGASFAVVVLAIGRAVPVIVDSVIADGLARNTGANGNGCPLAQPSITGARVCRERSAVHTGIPIRA